VAVDPSNLIQTILAEGKTRMKNTKIEARLVAEIVVFSALSALLYALRPFTLPFGGSITLGSMIPVFWLSLRRGAKVGIFSGAIFGAAALLIDVWYGVSVISNPPQLLLDYPIAFGSLGLAGFFQKRPAIGVGIGSVCRFIAHFISGILFFWMYASYWGLDPITYSLAYNGSFMFPEFIVSAIIIYLLYKKGILNIYL